jgi:hypothetical protein
MLAIFVSPKMPLGLTVPLRYVLLPVLSAFDFLRLPRCGHLFSTVYLWCKVWFCAVTYGAKFGFSKSPVRPSLALRCHTSWTTCGSVPSPIVYSYDQCWAKFGSSLLSHGQSLAPCCHPSYKVRLCAVAYFAKLGSALSSW